MKASKQKYCYAILVKGKLLSMDVKLPIYWNKKIAKDVASRFPYSEILRVKFDDILSVILHSIK